MRNYGLSKCTCVDLARRVARARGAEKPFEEQERFLDTRRRLFFLALKKGGASATPMAVIAERTRSQCLSGGEHPGPLSRLAL
jgi:hypothetical protein